MPSQIEVMFLLPTGIIICLKCSRDATLESIKAELWKEAKKYPLFYCLMDPSSYIFISINQDAEREEFYDETRRICDLRLFQPLLKLVEPMGNKEEKILNAKLSIAIGMPVNDFTEMKDLEVLTFRRSVMHACKSVVEEREVQGIHGLAMYVYPPDIHSSPKLPNHIMQIIKKAQCQIMICIWIVTSNHDRSKFTMKVPYNAEPNDVIVESIRRKIRTMNMSAEQQERCISAHLASYVLKVCGYEEYMLGAYPICQYKYIRRCLARGQIPELMLMSRDSLYNGLPKTSFTMPSYVLRGVGALQDLNNQHKNSLWNYSTPLRVKINVATYVNVKERGEIYVKTGVYHGTESLCPVHDTKPVLSTNPKWNEWLEYDLNLQDIPRSARLSISLCSIARKRKVHYAIAWGNVNLFDFTNRLVTDKVSLRLWPMPPGLEEMLNPIGIPGSNPNTDSPCVEVEFDRHATPICFPPMEDIENFAEPLERAYLVELPKEYPKSETELVLEIVRRDPLSEISEQEKELLWKLRHYCKQVPDSLPKLLQAMKWNSREEVSQLYLMLKSWPVISPEAALELLYCTYTDLTVRQFAVKCLKEKLSFDHLHQFLLQLVQVLEFEPYLDNHLTQFLLRQSLTNQRIGHFFFWFLRSEMHQTTKRLRFGLILEAYCRSCGSYLRFLCQQVEAIEKLTKLSEMLKLEKEDTQLRMLCNQIKTADYLEALQNFYSPLNYSHVLGELLVEACEVKSSKKRPLLLVWKNPDPMAECFHRDFQIIFKSGDDLRQDMLTLQVIKIMDDIWQSEGLDLRMIPYGCLATGQNAGMIEVVRNAKTVMHVLKQDIRSAMMVRTKELHSWIKEKNRPLPMSPDGSAADCPYLQAIEAFTMSCAGYCVATFILGIGDRHPSNIMVTEQGQVFHIDFGHFLDHRKKKFGINRERVPFVLTEDFIRVIAKGQDNPEKSPEFNQFMELCGKAYLCLHKHANVFITLFTMMLSCGIPELQSFDDIGYLRKTLMVDCKSEKEALIYFQSQFSEAYGGAWTTKLDWFFHWIKYRN